MVGGKVERHHWHQVFNGCHIGNLKGNVKLL